MTMEPVFKKRPELLPVMKRLVEPERQIIFRVPWVNDAGEVQVRSPPPGLLVPSASPRYADLVALLRQDSPLVFVRVPASPPSWVAAIPPPFSPPNLFCLIVYHLDLPQSHSPLVSRRCRRPCISSRAVCLPVRALRLLRLCGRVGRKAVLRQYGIIHIARASLSISKHSISKQCAGSAERQEMQLLREGVADWRNAGGGAAARR